MKDTERRIRKIESILISSSTDLSSLTDEELEERRDSILLKWAAESGVSVDDLREIMKGPGTPYERVKAVCVRCGESPEEFDRSMEVTYG